MQSNKHFIKICATILLLFALGLMLFGCGTTASLKQIEPLTETAFKLDTLVSISLYDEQDEKIIAQAFAEIDRLEQLLSVEKAGSDLAKLYENAGIQPIVVSSETIEVLKAAINYSKLSKGCFDVTAGPLIDLWNIHEGQGHYPTDSELEKATALVDYTKLQIDETKSTAFLTEKGMKVNLGAIAKGYIGDKVKAKLVEAGVRQGIINLGGNVLTIGSKPDGNAFGVGIQDPFKPTGEVIAAAAVADGSLVSSGIYQRSFEYQGKTYHHILNPFTGFPAESGLAAVTILSENSMAGDALSTICLLLGGEAATKLIQDIPEVEAFFVDSHGGITMTSGFRAKLLE